MTIPVLPDTERVTSYTIAVADTGPYSVGFHIYADGSDYAQWLEVWDDGVKLTAVTDYTVTSVAGGSDLSIIARPITDAQITFTTARSGAIKIVGARRPRVSSQFTNGQSITADQHNRRYTDLMAALREFWDLRSRMFLTAPGTTGGTISGPISGITGPSSSTDNAIARYNGTSGGAVQDSGLTIDDNNDVAGIRNESSTGYKDLTEIASPANPAANKLRVFAKDVGGITHLFARDSSGTETDFMGAATGIVSAEALGLRGDNATDNTPLWNAMLAVLPAGARIQFGTGIYLFNSQPNRATSAISLIGSGSFAKTLIVRNYTPAGADDYFLSYTGGYFYAENIDFICPNGTTGGRMFEGIQDDSPFQAGSWVAFYNCRWVGGLDFAGGGSCKTAIYLDGTGSTAGIRDCTFVNCWVFDTTGAPIEAKSPQQFTWLGGGWFSTAANAIFNGTGGLLPAQNVNLQPDAAGHITVADCNGLLVRGSFNVSAGPSTIASTVAGYDIQVYSAVAWTLSSTDGIFVNIDKVSGTWRPTFTPEQFGAAGDGITDDANALTLMFSAITSAGGGECYLTKTYLLASGVSLPNNVRIVGDGKATIKAHASATISGLFRCSGSNNQSGTISSNAALFDRDLTLTSATGFTTGKLIFILKTVGGGVFYHHTAEITDVAGSVITITPPMPFALATTDTYTLNAKTPSENISIENLVFDGSENTAVTRGVLLQNTRRLVLKDLHFQHFHGAAGAYVDMGFTTDVSNLRTTHCGTGSEAALNMRAQTAGHFHGCNDWYCHGFGQLHFMHTYSQFDTLSSNRAGSSVVGRGVKFDGLLYCAINGVEGNNSSSTGIAITLGSNFNTFSNLVALKNTGSGAGNDVGLWFDGTSSDNLINGVIAKGNNTADIIIPTGSDRNTIINADYDTMIDGSGGNVGGIDNIVLAKQNAGSYMLVGWADVNFNSANTDFTITIKFPTKYWRIGDILVINNGTTASLTTATGGVFTATGGGGTAICANQALSAITSNAVNGANGAAMTIAAGMTTRYVNYQTLYYRTGTAQGAAATGRVYIFGRAAPL